MIVDKINSVKKKGIGKIKRTLNIGQKSVKKEIILEDGGRMTLCNTAWLKSASRKYAEGRRRPNLVPISTNIRREMTHGLKCIVRDACLEDILQEGGYTFDNIFVAKNPFGETPLAALALFVTEKFCAVRVTVPGDIPETDYTYEVPAAKYHRVPILGMYPERDNRVHIALLDGKGQVVQEKVLPLHTRKLPKDLRDIITVKKVCDDPAFPNIMISGGLGINTCVFDREGKMRYYLRRRVKGYGIFPFARGHFLFMEKEVSIPSYSNPQCALSYDMDYLGRVYMTYLSRKGIHHTVEEKEPCGNFLTGSNTMLEHTEDMVIEIDRKTGDIVWSLKIEDLFDDTYKNMMDWAHVNSAAYYEKDNSILISLRNIHCFCSVDYTTKKLRWMFSDPEFWAGTSMTDKLLKPVGDVPWVYQQHSAFELDEDFDGNPDTKHIIVFDNHWAKRRKAASFDNDPLTYVSFYTVNEKEMTVSLYKRFPCPKTRIRANGIYCPEKGRVYSMAGSYAEPVDEDNGGVYEYDFETGEVLSEFGVRQGYFRAYNFEPDIEELTKPLPKIENYLGGDWKHPQRISEMEMKEIPISRCRRVPKMQAEYLMQEDLLFIHALDHSLKKVYFVGREGNYYMVGFDETYQTMDVFREVDYYYTIWANNLAADEYKLYIDLEGEVYRTGKYLKVTKPQQ